MMKQIISLYHGLAIFLLYILFLYAAYLTANTRFIIRADVY